MYSKYINGSFSPLHNLSANAMSPSDKNGSSCTGSEALLDKLKKLLPNESIDAGDILLVLIIFFLFLEGDNLELVITLGLMILFGPND